MLNILVIDDDKAKSQAVIAALVESAALSPRRAITEVETLSDAVRVVNRVIFDLIVLDLMLPYVQGGPPESRAGLELLRQLRMTGCPNKATTVIGISSFPEEIAAFRSQFDELGVLITRFDKEGSWSRALVNVENEIRSRSDVAIKVDFLMICALEEERDGFKRTALEKVTEANVSGLNVHYFKIPGAPELFGGVIRLSQIGLVAATFETALALSIFNTRVVGMSGICAGFAGRSHPGQLVIASPAWEYQAGKWSRNKFELAPLQVALRSGTRSLIDQVVSSGRFLEYVEAGIKIGETRPHSQQKVILGPCASGSAVIADRNRLVHIEAQHRKLAALDMETFGVYYVAHERQDLLDHFFSVKCIVDFADEDKADELHNYGCVVSARAAEQIIRALFVTKTQSSS